MASLTAPGLSGSRGLLGGSTILQHSSDNNSVEAAIDEERFSGNWKSVMKRLDKYVQIFDVQGSVTSSKQQEMPKIIKAYYWSVMAETVWCDPDKRDTVRAVECCQKSIESESDYHDARIVLCRILLDGCKSVLERIENIDPKGDAIGVFQLSPPRPQASPTHTKPIEVDFVPKDVLSEAFSSTQAQPWCIVDSVQAVLLSILCDAPRECRNVLLAALHSLTIADQIETCHHVLDVWRCQPSKRPCNLTLFAIWVLATCRVLLSGIRLDAILSKFESQLLTEYRLYLHIDAIATRCLLNELLGDHAKARNDCALLARSISSAREHLPSSCHSISVSASSRLVTLETASEMMQAAVGSFERCLANQGQGGNSFLLPESVMSGHKVQMSLLLLQRARRRGNGNGIGIGNGRADVDRAFSYLSEVREFMSARDNKPVSAVLTVAPHVRSLTQLLPQTPSDPLEVKNLATGRTVSVLMAAILRSREQSDSNSVLIADILEWGCSREAAASSELTYYSARALLDSRSGRIEDATNLLSQSALKVLLDLNYKASSATSVSENHSKSYQDIDAAKRDAEVALVLEWLGFYPPPSLKPWLPSGLLVELLLQKDALKATQQSRQSLLDLYDYSISPPAAGGSQGLASLLLLSLGSNEAVLPHPDSFFDPNSPSYDVSKRCRNEPSLINFSSKDVRATSLGSHLSVKGAAGAGTGAGTGTKGLDFRMAEHPGLAGALFRLGLSHAAMGRLMGTTDMAKRSHLRVALRCFCLLLEAGLESGGSLPQNGVQGEAVETPVKPPLPPADANKDVGAYLGGAPDSPSKSTCGGYLEDEGENVDLPEVSLQRAVVLAELGELTLALKEVRSALASDATSPSSSLSSPSPGPRLLHLLSVLLSCTGDDDPQTLGAASVLCQKALLNTPPSTLAHINIKATAALLDWNAGDSESALLQATQVLHFFRTTEKMRRLADEDGRRRAAEEEHQRRQREAADRAELVAAAARVRSRTSPLVGTQCCVPPWTSNENETAPSDTTQTEITSYILTHYGVGHTRITLQYKRVTTDVLLSMSRIFRSATDFTSAFQAVEEAWGVLYASSDFATMNMIGEAGILEHRRRELLRNMPTLLGWRLPECAGWGAEVLPDVEALVLVEAGNLVLAKGRAAGDAKALTSAIADAAELYRMALAIFPSCGEGLLALAEVELGWGEIGTGTGSSRASTTTSLYLENPFLAIIAAKESGRKEVATSSSNDEAKTFVKATLGECGHNSRGYEFALQALGLMELNPKAWCVYGKTLEMIGQPNRASEAYLASVEVASFSSFRQLASILIL